MGKGGEHVIGYWYDKQGAIHYYYVLEDLFNEVSAVMGDDFVRALRFEMQDEVQSEIDDYELAHQDDDEEDDY